jgi:hypothetical protein
MNSILTKLGVPKEVQAFFNVDELLFAYGEHFEHFDMDFHRVPTTQNLWLAGKDISREVIITWTAMEAISYLSVNHYRYPDLDALTFIAIGNLAQPGQLNWIRANYPGNKFTLVFSKDLLGKLADIRVAVGLNNKTVSLLLYDTQIQIMIDGKSYSFDQDSLSLNAFEKASGLRSGIRTNIPKEFNTYLDQLKHHATQRNSD